GTSLSWLLPDPLNDVPTGDHVLSAFLGAKDEFLVRVPGQLGLSAQLRWDGEHRVVHCRSCGPEDVSVCVGRRWEQATRCLVVPNPVPLTNRAAIRVQRGLRLVDTLVVGAHYFPP